MKRTKGDRECANPLFEKWLIEWRNEANAKGSYREIHFTQAIAALRKYPLPMDSGRDCIILQHFGTKLCTMLDKKLKAHKEAGRRIQDEPAPKKCKNPIKQISVSNQVQSQKKTCESRKVQVAGPIPRSRVHSISSSDFAVPAAAPATEIVKVNRRVEKTSEVQENAECTENSENLAENEIALEDKFTIAPNNFDVILLVDNRETGGSGPKSKDNGTKSELDKLGTRYEIRHLKIGDFVWVARCRDTGKELMLPYILERKRMDDFASSIKDGRYHEQKFRMKKTGIQNLIYMIESHGNDQYIGLPLSTLLQASTNSAVQDGFTVKFTKSHGDSMQFLSILTSLINNIYKEKFLTNGTKEDMKKASISSTRIALMEFDRFNKAASKVKVFKVKEMFIRQLLRLRGLSVEKALAIVERYPTPLSLINAFKMAGSEKGEKLLASIKVGSLSRNLGPALSKTLYQLYTKRILD